MNRPTYVLFHGITLVKEVGIYRYMHRNCTVLEPYQTSLAFSVFFGVLSQRTVSVLICRLDGRHTNCVSVFRRQSAQLHYLLLSINTSMHALFFVAMGPEYMKNFLSVYGNTCRWFVVQAL